jgi:predicted metalloendopeptidase
MKNVLLLLQLNAKQKFQKLRQPIDRQEWIEHGPTTVNAFYSYLFNDISKTS